MIKEARERKGLSMNKFSRLVGVTRPCVHLWERGETKPRPRTAERIEAVLDLEPGTVESFRPTKSGGV